LSEDLGHGEIQDLLGAYALGAVDDDERAIIDAHLQTCESCRIELDDHSRLAETLLRHASRVSPLASIESNGSAKKNGDAGRERRVRRWAAPVAIVIGAAILGGVFVQAEIRSNGLETRMQRIEVLERAQLAATDAAAVVTTLRTPRSEPVLTVVSRAAGGASYAMNSALPRLTGGRTYQLWRVDNGVITAAVALGPRPDATAFSLSSGVSGFLLTVETGPAPRRPTLPAVATGLIPS